jgi:uncharacterized protein RhaS with RHS repeats
MKVKDLFEGRNGFNIQYTADITDAEGADTTTQLDVTGTVMAMRDARGTGDSPMEYEVNVDNVTDEDGHDVEFTSLPRRAQEAIQQLAIDASTE